MSINNQLLRGWDKTWPLTEKTVEGYLNRPPKVRPKNLILGGRFFNGKIQF